LQQSSITDDETLCDGSASLPHAGTGSVIVNPDDTERRRVVVSLDRGALSEIVKGRCESDPPPRYAPLLRRRAHSVLREDTRASQVIFGCCVRSSVFSPDEAQQIQGGATALVMTEVWLVRSIVPS
jgi:hypothetical protein